MKYQVIIIGGGPAGYTAAEAAGKAGLSVLLIEKNNLGGVCLNEGCIPTKTLLYSAKTYDSARHSSKYAVNVSEVSFDLPKIIARKSKVVRKLVLGVKAKLTSNNVAMVTGEAQIIDKNTVRCGEETYNAENLILCTGSETFIPPITGVETVNYWTHRDALDSKELPASLAIVGGGVIGMEFASFFNSLGVQVTVFGCSFLSQTAASFFQSSTGLPEFVRQPRPSFTSKKRSGSTANPISAKCERTSSLVGIPESVAPSPSATAVDVDVFLYLSSIFLGCDAIFTASFSTCADCLPALLPSASV